MNEEPTKKRNMELIRAMLLWIESQPAGELLRTVGAPPEYTPGEVRDHLRIIKDAGLLDGKVEFHGEVILVAIHGLSNKGHDLLDSIRSEAVWEQTKEKVKEVGGTVSMDTLKAVATAILTKMLLG